MPGESLKHSFTGCKDVTGFLGYLGNVAPSVLHWPVFPKKQLTPNLGNECGMIAGGFGKWKSRWEGESKENDAEIGAVRDASNMPLQ